MRTFIIHYDLTVAGSPSEQTEQVEARGFADAGEWIDFYDLEGETKLRLRAVYVTRIEKVD